MPKYDKIHDRFYGNDKGYKGQLIGLCPKCGNSPKVKRNRRFGTFVVECTICCHRSLEYISMRDAINTWNILSKEKLAYMEGGEK